MVWAGYSEKGQGGEERGPSTFTFVPPDVVRASPGVQGQAVPVQMGMSGSVAPGLTTQAPGVDAAGADRTLQMLTKVGEDIMAPHMKKLREKQYLTGMQRAASGEAMQDIVNTQPWYTKIYGDGPLVEGARAYTVETTAGSWAAKQEQEMEKLRTHKPEAIPGMLAESMKALSTGDADTDAALQARVMSFAPQLIKRQTKEHYKWQQETISRQRVDAIMTQGSLLNLAQTASAGIYTPEEIQQRKDSLMAVSTPAMGADPESWEKDLATSMGLMAEKGNFHAVAAFREAGVVARMNPEKRLAVENMINRFEVNHASEASIEYSPRISQIKEDAQNGVISAKRVHQLYDEMNSEYRLKSGNSQPLIRKGDYVADERAAMSAVFRMQRATAAAAAAQTDTQAARSMMVQTIMQGGYATAINQGGNVAALAKATFNSEWNRLTEVPPNADANTVATNKALANKMLVDSALAGPPNPHVQNTLEILVNSVSGQTYHPNFGKAFDVWKNMAAAGGQSAQVKYFGAADHKRLMAFNSAMGGRDPADPKNAALADIAYQQARRSVSDEKALSKDDTADAVKRINAQAPGLFFKDYKMTSGSMNNILSAITPHMRNFGTQASGDELFKMSMGGAQATGLETVGRWAWTKDEAQAPIETFFQNEGKNFMTPEKMGKAVDETLRLAAQERGLDVEKLQVYRVADRGGRAYFHAQVQGSNDLPIVINSDQIKAFGKKDLLGNQRNPWEQPGIYARPEEWAAYREYQRKMKANKP